MTNHLEYLTGNPYPSAHGKRPETRNTSDTIKQITKLYNFLKFDQRFAKLLPSIIKIVLRIKNEELLYLFNIKRKATDPLISDLDPIHSCYWHHQETF